MDFVAVMLFSQQVFHLECLLFFWTKSQPGVAYKKKHVTLFFSLLKMKKWFFHMSLFLFFRHFTGATLMEKSCQKWGGGGVRKKYKKRNGHIGGGLSIEGGSNLLYTMIFKG